jgi:phosphoglycolate phosphatase
MRYRLFLFDFDGTLADSFPAFVRVFDELAAKHRYLPFDRQQLPKLRRLDARRILQHHKVPMWKLPVISHEMRQIMTREIASIPLFPGVQAILAHLAQQGAKLAIVSSNSLENVQHVLGPGNTANIHHYECGSSLFGKASRIRRAMDQMSVGAEKTILIGDEIRDAKAAAKCGIHFAAVGWGYTELSSLTAAGAHYSISKMENLLPTLLDCV